MKFRLFAETKTGSAGRPLYHAHPNVDELRRVGFTDKNIDMAGSGMGSVSVDGGRLPYGASEGIHLSRSYEFCKNFAQRFGPDGGVVEVFFNVRKPFQIPAEQTARGKTVFTCFVHPEEKYLVPLSGDRKRDMDQVARIIESLVGVSRQHQEDGAIHHLLWENRDKPVWMQAKKLAQLMFIPQGYRIDGWPSDYTRYGEGYAEPIFAKIGPNDWKTWANKGYLDSVWWGHGSGPFHGEDEVTVFSPGRLRVGSVVFRNRGDDPIPRARTR